MRCLALADELQGRGVQSSFLCSPLPGNLFAQVAHRGHRLIVLPGRFESDKSWDQTADALASMGAVHPGPDDWLVADHYRLDRVWEARTRSSFGRIFVIDDLANRPHDCDLLLDQNRSGSGRNAYADCVGTQCQFMFGPRYALLSPQFGVARKTLGIRRGRMNRVLVFFGSSDEENYTEVALRGIALWGQPVHVFVVIGEANPNRKAIETWCRNYGNADLLVQTNRMADIMAQSDFAIGAAGSSTWERCCMGLPSILAVCADNQLVVSETSAECGVAHNIGPMEAVSPRMICDALAATTPEARIEMERRAFDLVDGNGAARVVENLVK